MTKLNQIIAIEKGVKSRAYSELTEINKAIQKPDLFAGAVRTYNRRDEDSEDLPAERKNVQMRAHEVMGRVAVVLGDLFDIVARKDWTNCVARADVVVDGEVILGDVPVTYLLFLEKQITDVRTLVGNMPTLDESDVWEIDHGSGLYRTEPTLTNRTKKTARPIVLYNATPEHPAQTQLITEDIVVGQWSTTRMSGGMSKPRKDEILERVEALLRAIKQAREEANSIEEVVAGSIGARVFGFLMR